jgi:dipeptidyl aminopeptidase/acylaminoacyl peptidase
MTELLIAPYGSWPSPITSELIVSDTVGIGQVEVDGDDVWWAEARPAEQGRVVVVRRRADGGIADAFGPGWNARTRVHEYGGSCFAVDGDTLLFTNFADQRLHRSDGGGEPYPLTPEGDLRYGDLCIDRERSRVLCVLEDHTRGGAEAVNCIAAAPLDGGAPQVLVEGSDFCAAPRLSPDGRRLCWLTWNHPDLPWDGTQLWVADLDAYGKPGDPVLVAGGPRESVLMPVWSPGGVLHLVSDRTGWWNLYRWRGDVELEALCPAEMEFARPAWLLGWTTYAFLGEEHIVCTATRRGEWRLYELHPEIGLREVPTRFTEILPWLRVHQGGVVFAGGSPVLPAALVHVDVESGGTEVLRRSSTLELDPDYLSTTRHGTPGCGAQRTSCRHCWWRATAAPPRRPPRCCDCPSSTGPAAASPFSTSTTAAAPGTDASTASASTGSGGWWTSTTAPTAPASWWGGATPIQTG